jgi:sugar lactone lactonase YvrE
VLYVANNWGNSVFVYEPGRDRPSRMITAGVDAPIATAVDDGGDLFVANQGRGHFPKGSVTIYRPGDVKPIRRITDGINELGAMAIDGAGDVFAANYRGNQVYEYLAGTTNIGKTISNGVAGVVALGVDPSGYLYVSNCQHCLSINAQQATLTIYRPRSFELFHTIVKSWRDQPAETGFDQNGNLYFDAGGSIDVYQDHGKRRLRTIGGAAGVFCFDALGNLYSAQRKYINYGGRVLVYASGAKTPKYTIIEGVYAPLAVTTDGGGNLYVANSVQNEISVYALGDSKPSRTIQVATGLVDPQGLAFDPAGNLYVANAYSSNIYVFAPGSTKLVRTIESGTVTPTTLRFDAAGSLYVGSTAGSGPSGFISVYEPGKSEPRLEISKGINGATYSLAFDAAGNLYVASGCPQHGEPITVYAPRKRNVLRTIGRAGINPCAIALDASGNLYAAVVGDPGDVSVFAPGDSVPSYMITKGVNYPDGLAFDASGNLYVSNGYGGNSRRWGSVSVYRPGGQRPFRRITQGFKSGAGDPVISPSGDLYVGDGNTIHVYRPGDAKPILTITKGLHAPTAAIFDSAGNLYVANQGTTRGSSTVTVYAPGSGEVLRTYPAAKAYPDALAVGPAR